MVLSDHGHSSVAAEALAFPLRGLVEGHPGPADPAGYSVSGAVRTADLLAAAGFFAADGLGPLCSPVLSGIGVNNSGGAAASFFWKSGAN